MSFHVEADRFLHHMVRMLVGTMVDIGLGRRPLSDIEMLLELGDNQRTSPPAPPQGLYFVRATYPGELYLDGDDTADSMEGHSVSRARCKYARRSELSKTFIAVRAVRWPSLRSRDARSGRNTTSSQRLIAAPRRQGRCPASAS